MISSLDDALSVRILLNLAQYHIIFQAKDSLICLAQLKLVALTPLCFKAGISLRPHRIPFHIT